MLNLKRNDRIIVRDVMGREHELTLVAHSPDYDAARVAVDHSTDDYTIRQFSRYFVRKV